MTPRDIDALHDEEYNAMLRYMRKYARDMEKAARKRR